MRHLFLLASVVILGLAAIAALAGGAWLPWLVPLVIVVAIGLYDMGWATDNVRRNYPVLGRLKTLWVKERHLPRQMVIEGSREGAPFDWIQRRIVAARTRESPPTQPFGSEYDQLDPSWEGLAHSAFPVEKLEGDLRFEIGGPSTTRPYSSSILNVSAMSFGSLGPRAVRTLNEAAALGGFAQNTGEGGISEYHLSGGDLIYQIGTGYFGCRDSEGNFSADAFRKVLEPQVKMIEIKISQGAKPGLGGILPAAKNTEEIARVRGIEPHTDVHSPHYHKAFGDPAGLLRFVSRLRELADGRPVGFKLCLGRRREWRDICRAMKETGELPDFVTVDSADGGTGAGAHDFIHWVGMHVRDSLPFMHRTLVEAGLRESVRLLAAGKVVTGFDVVRMLALGADGCYSARGMLFALGCVQALKCGSNRCPTGITTLDPSLNRGIVVDEKKVHVARYHHHTIEAVKDLLAAAGVRRLGEVDGSLLLRRATEGALA